MEFPQKIVVKVVQDGIPFLRLKIGGRILLFFMKKIKCFAIKEAWAQ
jgi:hypothetical protein